MRRSYLKTLVVVGLAAGLFLACGAFSPSNAAPIEPTAAFKVVDNFGGGDGDKTVKLTFLTTLSGLQYEYGGNPWNDLVLSSIFPGLSMGTLDVPTGNDNSEIVYFQTTSGKNTATIQFYGFDDPLWNSVALDFNTNNGIFSGLVFATPGKGDHVAPVPIPAAFWLFGSGLLGLIGIRRKVTH